MSNQTFTIEQIAYANPSNRKILAMLNELYQAAKEKPIEIDITEMCRTYHLSPGIGAQLYREEIITRYGKAVNQWTINKKPDIIMADTIRKKLNIHAAKQIAAHKQGKKYIPHGIGIYQKPFNVPTNHDRIDRGVLVVVGALMLVVGAILYSIFFK